MKFKQGDYVRVVEREQTPADVKDGSFYPYFCGLKGTIDRVYDDEVCIKVDLESLPDDVLKRHLDIQENIKRKWLKGLSGEGRNRLTPEEKQFELAYTMLIKSDDLEKAKPAAKAPRPVEEAAKPAPEPVDTVKAVTPKDLEAAELAFLKEREKQLKAKK